MGPFHMIVLAEAMISVYFLMVSGPMSYAFFRIYDKGQNSITQLKVLSDELDFSKSEAAPKKTEKKKETVESKVIEVDFTARKKE
jgi:hypothetical protein